MRRTLPIVIEATSNMISTQCHKDHIWGWFLKLLPLYSPFRDVLRLGFPWFTTWRFPNMLLPNGLVYHGPKKRTLTICKCMIWGYPYNFLWKASHFTRHRWASRRHAIAPRHRHSGAAGPWWSPRDRPTTAPGMEKPLKASMVVSLLPGYYEQIS